MKAPFDDLNIPELAETATDSEVEAAYKYLCKLQKTLRALQNKISRNSKILYDIYSLQKREKCLRPGQEMKWENGKEAVAVEKSRKIMKDLSRRSENLATDPTLLAEVNSWRLK